MNLIPLENISSHKNVLPILVCSLREDGIEFHGLTKEDAYAYYKKQSIESIAANLPTLPTNNSFILFLAATTTDTLKDLEIVVSIRLSGNSGIVDVLALEIFSQEGPEPLSPETLTWNPELSEDGAEAILEPFQGIVRHLITLQPIATEFTKVFDT